MFSRTYEPNPPGRGSLHSLPIDVAADSNSGSVNISFPLNLTKSRALTPNLSLNYHSNQGNSVFGMGFDLNGMLHISRSTKYGVPTYDDNKDIFVLSNAGELVKVKEEGNIITYRPRLDTQFSTIEYHITERTWLIREANGINHYLGHDGNSRIVDNENVALEEQRIFKWWVGKTVDVYGNQIRYQYSKERLAATEQRSASQSFYLTTVLYGNYTNENNPLFAFRCVLDYGNLAAPGVNILDNQPLWAALSQDWQRPDQSTSYKSGFAITTYKLCQRVLLFHHFDEANCLVKYWQLTYQQVVDNLPISLIAQIQEIGCRSHSDGRYLTQALLPANFTFLSLSLANNELQQFQLNTTLPQTEGTYQWVDLYRDGLPGILYHDGHTALYWRSEGNGEFSAPRVVFPSPKHMNFYSASHARFMHLGSEKKTALAIVSNEEVGYYLLDEESMQDTDGVYQIAFSEEKKFATLPFAFTDPMNEMVDLNGAGKNDLLVLNTEYPHFYAEKDELGEGYDASTLIDLPPDFPRRQFNPYAFVGFVDIFGDGLLHRVKVSRDGIDIWPNIGYGRFLPKIHWPLPPLDTEEFDPSCVFFVDVDGSGASDFVYAKSTSASVYLNRGTQFSNEPLTLNFPEGVVYTHLDQLLFGDFLGQGVSAVILIKKEAQSYQYFMGSFARSRLDDDVPDTQILYEKPYLLSEMTEPSGLKTTLAYSTTLASYLQDRQHFPAIRMRLPFVLSVLQKTEVTDPVIQVVTTTRYEYHHGVYDFLERNFCGFAYVEERKTEILQGVAATANAVEKRLIKSWFYNRAITQLMTLYPGFIHLPFGTSHFISPDIGDHYYKVDENNNTPEIELSAILDNDLLRKSLQFTLRGRLLRQEYWGAGVDAPDAVTQQNYNVRCDSLPIANKQGVFVIQTRSHYNLNYQQKNEEPRVARTLNLKFDEYNNILEAIKINYGRRQVFALTDIFVDGLVLEAETLAAVNPLLTISHALLHQAKFIAIENQLFNFLHIPTETSDYDLSQTLTANSSELFTEMRIWRQNAAQIMMKQTHYYYWDDTQQNQAPFGEVGGKALLHHRESMLGDVTQVQRWYDQETKQDDQGRESQQFKGLLQPAELLDTMLATNGYVLRAGQWWQPELVNHYGDAAQYYQLISQASLATDTNIPGENLFHMTMFIRDHYELAIIQKRECLTLEAPFDTKFTIDYQTMQPCQVLDHNKNSQIIFRDALGQLIAYTQYGQLQGSWIGNPVTVDPTVALVTRDLSDMSFALCETLVNANVADVLANPGQYLGLWLRLNYYDLDHQPRRIIQLTQGNYLHPALPLLEDHPARVGVSIHYFDSFGNQLQSKHQTDDARWLSSGLRVQNKERLLLWQSLPKYTEVAACDSATFSGQDNILWNEYDANLALKLQQLPSGDNRQIINTAWYQIFYDQNAMFNKQDQTAAEKLPASSVVRFFDNQGNQVAYLRQSSVQNNGYLLSTTKWDVLGHIQEQRDCRLTKPNLTIDYNLLGQVVARRSVDRGAEFYFYNFKNTLVRKRLGDWAHIFDVDSWQRPLSTRVYSTDSDTLVSIQIESRIYGEMQDEPEIINACGQVVEHINEEGKVALKVFDLNGQCIRRMRSILLPSMTSDIETHLDAASKQPRQFASSEPNHWKFDSFNFEAEYDSLGNLVAERLPNGFVVVRNYNRLSQISKISAGIDPIAVSTDNDNPITINSASLRPAVTSVDYHEMGVIKQLNFNNNISDQPILTTNFEYDDARQRLKGIKTTLGQNSIVQDEQYVFDAVGNITAVNYGAITDNPVVPFNQQSLQHQYDDFYRLRQSQGLELKNKNITSNPHKIRHQLFSEGNIAQVYTQKFTYDESSNIKSIHHNSGLLSHNWHLDFEIETESNKLASLTTKSNKHLSPNKTGPDRLEEPLYDDAGNMRQIDRRTTVDWNHNNQLRKIDKREKPGSTKERDQAAKEYYGYAGRAHQEVPFADNVGNQASVPHSPAFFGKPAAPKIDSKPFAEYGNRLYKITSFKKTDGSFEVIEQIFLGSYGRKQIFVIPAETSMEVTPILVRHTLNLGSEDKPLVSYHHFDLDIEAREAAETITHETVPNHPTREQWRYHVGNHLHSQVMDFDEQGHVLSIEAYQAYGQIGFILTIDGKQLHLKDYHYSNQIRDKITALYYYGARYYSPMFGRWLSPDPVGLIDTSNLYAFVEGNPLSRSDRFGFFKFGQFVRGLGDAVEGFIDTIVMGAVDAPRMVYAVGKYQFTGNPEDLNVEFHSNLGKSIANAEDPSKARNEFALSAATFGLSNTYQISKMALEGKITPEQADELLSRGAGAQVGGVLIAAGLEAMTNKPGNTNVPKQVESPARAATRARVLKNIEETRAGTQSSNFPRHVEIENAWKAADTPAKTAGPPLQTAIAPAQGAPLTSPARAIPTRPTVPLPNVGESDMAYGTRVHQEFPRIVQETNPGAGGEYNVAPGLTGEDLAHPTGMNANYAEMKSLWGKQSDMLRQARKWGYDAQSGRYFFYDRNTGQVYEGIIQTEKFPSGRFRPNYKPYEPPQ